jgi:hypothetical protein
MMTAKRSVSVVSVTCVFRSRLMTGPTMGLMMVKKMTDYEPKGNEQDWLGPKDQEKHIVYEAQSAKTERRWFFSKDLIELDPDYSEFSVRIHDPRCRSLSFVYRTMAILPKSQLRTIYNLIGAYLERMDT